MCEGGAAAAAGGRARGQRAEGGKRGRPHSKGRAMSVSSRGTRRDLAGRDHHERGVGLKFQGWGWVAVAPKTVSVAGFCDWLSGGRRHVHRTDTVGLGSPH